MKWTLLAFAGLCCVASAQVTQAASLFVGGSTFQVQGSGAPDTYNDTVALTPGTTLLDGGAVSLSLSIVAAGGGSEWLVFDYSTTSGAALGSPGVDWSLSEVGLDAAVPVTFAQAFVDFSHDGTVLTPTSSIFSGYSVMSNPVPGGSGTGLGTGRFSAPFGAGPLPSLGTYIDPWNYLDSTGINSAQVNGYEQAFLFTPTLSAVPLPATLPLFGAAVFGLGVVGTLRRRRGAVSPHM